MKEQSSLFIFIHNADASHKLVSCCLYVPISFHKQVGFYVILNENDTTLIAHSIHSRVFHATKLLQ